MAMGIIKGYFWPSITSMQTAYRATIRYSGTTYYFRKRCS